MNGKKIQVVYKGVDELIPYINNPRLNDDAVDAVASSIKNFGFKNPIVIDSDSEIINGHTRLKAAKKLGLDTVPVIIADDLTEAQKKAFRLADNKVSEIAKWDFEILESELEELDMLELDFDMEDFGFSNNDLNELYEEDEMLDINENQLDGNSNDVNNLVFGDRKIIITDEELEMLENKYNEYIDTMKVSYGFIRWLINEN